jgi:hypothetical protein
MEDILYVVLTAAFFGVCWLMVELFDRLSRSEP